MSAKKILVVEDDRPSAAILAYKLKASGYSVVVAPDGASAVTMVRAEKPDLMILDLGLPSKDPFSGPNWDGFGVIDWLHRTRPDEAIPTIVVTAWRGSWMMLMVRYMNPGSRSRYHSLPV